jgi:hypothetical protein
METKRSITLENLAVMFRVNHPNLGHVSTLDAMTEAGLAYMYGHYRGIPERYHRKRRKLRETIARELDRKAKQLSSDPMSSSIV